ncbi:AI-2E family transporter [Streptomyces chattanoogensis]|uniref:AI-2E family transporter n=1 Tax=Streptomyces chattanoogensis TaxID=66876 RepID=UPI00367A326B
MTSESSQGGQPTGRKWRRAGRRRGSLRSWFAAGFGATLGGALAYWLAREALRLSELMVLLLLSFFVAVSLDPLVRWLVRHRLPRGWAVTVVLLAFVVLLAGFLALVIPPVTEEVTAFAHAMTRWLRQLHDNHTALGRFEARFHLVGQLRKQFSSGVSPRVLGGLLGAGQLVVSAVTASLVVVVVALYCMAGLPQIKTFCFQFVPGSRREQMEALTEEILTRTGWYMLGNIVTSGIAGLATFIWCVATGVPYSAALGVLVALLDLVPMVGSTIGGIIVSLVALAVSLPIAIGTAAFYIAFRLAEDYFIVPRVMKYAVRVSPIVTVVAVLVGAALLGIIGALLAIPAAMAVGLVLDKFVFPKIKAA